MGQPPDARLTPGVAREICERTASAGVLDGSIASLGSQYVLGLKAVDCHTGDYLAQEQATADGKERMLKALDEAATRLRSKLGESFTAVHKSGTPISEATTSSLEALKAFSMGRQLTYERGPCGWPSLLAASRGARPQLRSRLRSSGHFIQHPWAGHARQRKWEEGFRLAGAGE
jgi:hypothetical protein